MLSIGQQISGIRKQRAADIMEKRRAFRSRRGGNDGEDHRMTAQRKLVCTPENLAIVERLVGSISNATSPLIQKESGLNETAVNRLLNKLVADGRIVILAERAGPNPRVYAIPAEGVNVQKARISPMTEKLITAIRELGGRATIKQVSAKSGMSVSSTKGALRIAKDINAVKSVGSIKERGISQHIYGLITPEITGAL